VFVRAPIIRAAPQGDGGQPLVQEQNLKLAHLFMICSI